LFGTTHQKDVAIEDKEEGTTLEAEEAIANADKVNKAPL